jgi:hypothetical protein
MADNVFINGRAAIHAGSAGKSIAFPDVCLCPPSPPSGPIPTPLTNTAQAPDLQGGAATVTIDGHPVAHAKSYIGKSTGDEVAQSTGGGIITHQFNGAAYFQTFSMDVFIENQPAVRHLDLLTHNHMAPMPGNTPPAPWMSTMLAGAGAAPKESEKDANEGKDKITILFVDESGAPLGEIDYEVTTPKGAKVTGRPGSVGRLVLQGLAKGKCQLSLPRHDLKCKKITRALPKNLPGAAVLYKPGQPLELQTGKRHEVLVPWTINLGINVCIGEPGSAQPKDKFVLKSTDESYMQTVAVRAQPGLNRWHMRLEFRALIPGTSYTLEFQPASGGDGHKVFADRPLDELLSSRKTPRAKEG